MKSRNLAYKTLQMIAIIFLIIALIVTGAYFLVQSTLSSASESDEIPELFGYKFIPVLTEKTASVGIAEIGDMILLENTAYDTTLNVSDTVAFKATDDVRTNLYGENFSDYCLGVVTSVEDIDGEQFYYISTDLEEFPQAVATTNTFYKGTYSIGFFGTVFESMISSFGIVYYVTIPVALFVIMQLVAVLVKVLTGANSDELLDEVERKSFTNTSAVNSTQTKPATDSEKTSPTPLFISKIDTEKTTTIEKPIERSIFKETPRPSTDKERTIDIQLVKSEPVKPAKSASDLLKPAATVGAPVTPIVGVNIEQVQSEPVNLNEEKKKIVDDFLETTPSVSLDDEIMLIDKLLKEIPSSPIVEQLMKSETISTLNSDFLPKAETKEEEKSVDLSESFALIPPKTPEIEALAIFNGSVSESENLDNTIEFDLALAKQGLPVDEEIYKEERDNFIKIAETFALNNFVSIDLKEDAIDFDFKNIKAQAIEVRANENGDGFIIETPNYQADIKVDVKRK